MADMVPEQTDVNSQEASAASSTAVAQGDTSNTPTVENTGEAKAPENKIPQGRFNEVIQERNTEREARERLEARIRELESVRQEGPKRQSFGDIEAKRLAAKLGMEESAASEIVATFQNLTQAQQREQEAARQRQDAFAWADQKGKVDPLYKDIEPELDKSFSALRPEMQQYIAQNPDALEMFYENVKAKHLVSKSKDSYNKGAEDASKNKLLKQAVSSVHGTSAPGGKTALTRKSLAAMDTAEYMKRLPEINEAIKSGTLK